MPRPRPWIGQLACAVAALAALAVCARPIVRDGVVGEDRLQKIVASAARVRAIEPRGPIAARTVDRQELLAVLSAAIEVWKTPEQLADYERALVALGLWPADRELYAEALAVYGEEIVGIYVPASAELLLVVDAAESRPAASLANFEVEFALSHEVIHLLQHQAYPELMDPDWMPKNSDDLEAAIQAALEGDALRFGFAAVGAPAPTPETWQELIAGQLPGLEGGALAQAPALIRLTFDFPYARGYALAWKEELGLLDAPPISTEQVLHDDRRREPFLQLDLGELERRLPASCRTLQRNTVGELQISVLFRDLSDDPPPAIWEGWNGDRYLAADCAGRTEWVWWTAWDSERDAAEFASAYRGLAAAVAARAGSAPPLLAQTAATYVVVASAGLAREVSKPPPPAARVADLRALQALLRGGEAQGGPR